MGFSPEHAAKYERHVVLGGEEGAMDALVDYGIDVSSDEAVDAHGGITSARHFSLGEELRHGGRRLYADAPGVIGYNLDTAGERGSLTIVKLPDSDSLLRGTAKFLDTSENPFRSMDEEELCIRAVAEASYFYLSLGKAVPYMGDPLNGRANGNGRVNGNGNGRAHGRGAIFVPAIIRV